MFAIFPTMSGISALLSIGSGSVSAVAAKLTEAGHPCSRQNVEHWKKAGAIPPRRVLAIEAATGISRHDLNPTIYPRAPAKRPSRKRRAG
jgi:DNA-binding transcriptional regulator YdaS (Cro superfamily)